MPWMKYLRLLTEDEFKQIKEGVTIDRITFYNGSEYHRWYFYFIYGAGSYYASNDLLMKQNIEHDRYICNGYIITYFDDHYYIHIKRNGHECNVDNVNILYDKLLNKVPDEFIDYIASLLLLRNC